MENRVYGYARVSSKEQNEDRQLNALLEFGVLRENIITDKVSGKDISREGYMYLKNSLLRNGDILVIKELDRLSRNKSDIKKELEYFKEHNIRVKILDIPTTLADFPDGQQWVLDMINNILIEVLGSIAEAERIKIKQRQREGINSARKRGTVKFGRPKANIPDNWYEILSQVHSGEIKSTDAMRILNMKKSTYYKLRKLYPLKLNK